MGTQSWTLDPLGRFNTCTFTPQVGPGVTTVKTNHYTGDGDNPAWSGGSATDPNVVTRHVTGIDGRLALSTSKTGDRIVHSVFGAGTVIELNREQNTYLIQFDALETVRRIGTNAKLTAEAGGPDT